MLKGVALVSKGLGKDLVEYRLMCYMKILIYSEKKRPIAGYTDGVVKAVSFRKGAVAPGKLCICLKKV